jgi:hypothetical protein
VPKGEDAEEGKTAGGWGNLPAGDFSLGFGEAAAGARVVFVPGILGSKLVDSADGKLLFGNESMVSWLAQPFEWVRRMRQGDGIAASGSVRPAGLTSFNFPTQRFDEIPYDPAIARFRSALGPANVIVFAYDWRLSNETNAARLQSVIARAWPDAASDPARRGAIVAHSMGGLIARHFIENLGGNRFVSRLITVGTPHHGAPGALQSLMEPGGAATLASFIAPPVLGPALSAALGVLLLELQRMLGNFASIYQLMPDFDFVFPSAAAPAMESIAMTYQRLANDRAFDPALGPPGGARSLIRGPNAPILRRLNRGLTPDANLPAILSRLGVQYFCVAGFLHETVVHLRQIAGTSFTPFHSRCGDSTVPLRSAAPPPAGPLRTFFTTSPQKHSDLFRDPAIQQLCLNVITGAASPTAGTGSSFVASPHACPPPHPGVTLPPSIPGPAGVVEAAEAAARRAAEVPGAVLRRGREAAEWLRKRAGGNFR